MRGWFWIGLGWVGLDRVEVEGEVGDVRREEGGGGGGGEWCGW